MFVTISVLIDELEVIKEQVYNMSLCPIPANIYLKHRRDIASYLAYTPVRVVITKLGSRDIHVVEFTGCHYCVTCQDNDPGRSWWANSGCIPDSMVPDRMPGEPMMYVFQPFVTVPDVRPLTETESLMHDYALTLANDYFNDRFHLADSVELS